jgi:hypothetical protein
LLKREKEKIDNARRAVERLEEYAASPEGVASLGPSLYSLTEDKLFMALCAINFKVQVAAGDSFKHTFAHSLLKAVKSAARLFRLNVAPDIFLQRNLTNTQEMIVNVVVGQLWIFLHGTHQHHVLFNISHSHVTSLTVL